MSNQFLRTELLIGSAGMHKLHNSRIAVFGVGGVGGYAVEALVRSGVGAIDIIDNDTVCLSNLNRQIIATHDTIGRRKVDVVAERAKSINPDCRICTYPIFFNSENVDSFDFAQYDYIIDAIDTVSSKLILIERAYEKGTPIISSMGAGNKMDASALCVADIYDTNVCPLARVMRRELRKRNIEYLKVVYSTEPPIKPQSVDIEERVTGSTAFVPAVAGLIAAGEVIKDLIK